MKLLDVIDRRLIRVPLIATAMEEAVRELAETMVAAGRLDDAEGVCRAVIKREELGSTGIGNGVAVPHTKWPGVDRLCMAAGNSLEGVAWNSLDGEPVHLVFMLVSPADGANEHLHALEVLSRMLCDDTARRFLIQSATAEDFYAILEEVDMGMF